MGCPKVELQIAEAEELWAAGKCWCDCVGEDIPRAKELLAAGKCGPASSVIRAGLRRCDRGGGAGAPPILTKIEPIPIEAMRIEPMKF